jgi:long-chain acyl-CoA synthetase
MDWCALTAQGGNIMNFSGLLEKQASRFPEKNAVIFHDSPVTFSQLKDTAFKVAAGLNSLGVLKSEKVAIFLPNFPEYIYSFLGIFILRGVSVPLDFMLTEEEVVNFLNHSESKVLITQEKKGLDLEKVAKACPGLKKVIIFGEKTHQGAIFSSWDELLNTKAVLPKISVLENDPAAIFYTSGSTGHPKGVMLNYGHFDNPIACFDYFIHPSDKDSLTCAGVPFSHLGGLDYMLFMLSYGITLVLMERFHPLEFLKAMEKYKTTIFCIVPAMYVAILSMKEYDKFDLSALRFAVVFGAPSSPVLLERFIRLCPNAYLLNGWGMTETAAPNSFLPTGTNTKEVEHTGKFLPGIEAKLADDDGNAVAEGLEGELLLKGKAIMDGYFKEPELTAQVITKDGWLKTGDIARRDEQGRYSIVGRKKEMLKVAGEIVFCPEVEEVIMRHPKVKEAAVIGMPDKLRGEVPKAVVSLKTGENMDAEELRVFLRQHLAHFKIPHHFEFAPELPKNRVGKIDKEKLKQAV